MECAICFDAIGPARAMLGCSHTFHINCIVAWYYRQNIGCDLEKHQYEAGLTASSCPCCRAAPASKADDIPNEQLINFVPAEEDDDSTSLSSDSEGGPEEEDEELAAASPRSLPSWLQPGAVIGLAAQPPVPASPVPPLDLSSLQLRWRRTSSPSWERVIEEEGEEEPQTWDAAHTSLPPPDSLVHVLTHAARQIQLACRTSRICRARSASPTHSD